MHGSELGEAGMHTQVKHWASQGFMDKLLEILKKYNFQIISRLIMVMLRLWVVDALWKEQYQT